MLKHLLAIIILSIIVILFLPQFGDFLHTIALFHAFVSSKLFMLFSGSGAGKLISHVLALLIIPVIIALVPAFFYWLIRKREMPYLIPLLWVLWVMLATILALR